MRRVSEGETRDLEAYPCAMENELVKRMKLEIERKRKIVEQGAGGAGYYILSTSTEITLELN